MDRLRPPLVDAWIACCLLLLAQAEIWTGLIDAPLSATVPTAFLFTLPLAWRQRAPDVVAVLVISGVAVRTLLGVNASAGITETITVVIAAYSLGFHETLPRAAIGLAPVLALTWVAVAASDGTVAGDYVFAAILVSAPWFAGRAVVAVQTRARSAERRTKEVIAEQEAQARAAVAEERQRIARELHDVIAHNLTVMLMNVGATRRFLKEGQDRERQSLMLVEATGRNVLAEMRRLVGMLRVTDETPALGPQPSLRRVDELVKQSQALGLTVELSVKGCRPSDLPAGVDLAAYRIVQESLTNVVKHAGASVARVCISYTPEEIRIKVLDDGRSQPKSNALGHGLVGMKERAALYGGTVEAGPSPDGGFGVYARLRIDERANGDPRSDR